ncbi:RNA polymerase sigma factor [Gryllotalpicola reticulitermitis]|uniref:RNA polymerase sigma factor n=1 Tax=Gryllotalpicola reticulitermitis TaxID=1184153 RepID=A0ABV8Q050_9MICO
MLPDRELNRRDRESTGVSTDRDIIAESLTDPAVFGLLFQRHSGPVSRYAVKRLGVDEAQDIVSETFATAFRQRARFDRSREDAGPWLFGIATNLIRKQRGVEARALRALEVSRAAFIGDVDSGPALVDRLDAERELGALASTIRDLTARDRDTLLLYAWADLDYKGVAQALGVPIGTVRSRLNRVRRKLTAAAAEAGIHKQTTTKTEGARDGRVGEGAQSAL